MLLLRGSALNSGGNPSHAAWRANKNQGDSLRLTPSGAGKLGAQEQWNEARKVSEIAGGAALNLIALRAE
jgi:hypothetical protein